MIFSFLKRKKPKKSASRAKPDGEEIGVITHYFSRCRAGVIKLKKPLSVGDNIQIQGHTTDFKQKIDSMQINGKSVNSAQKPDEVGFIAKKRVRGNDLVYKLK